MQRCNVILDPNSADDTADRTSLDNSVIGVYAKLTKAEGFGIQLLKNIQFEARFLVQCVLKAAIELPEYLNKTKVSLRYKLS